MEIIFFFFFFSHEREKEKEREWKKIGCERSCYGFYGISSFVWYISEMVGFFF